MRVVFDTSALIGAVLRKNSISSKAFFLALEKHRIISSASTLQELKEKLPAKKFDKYVSHEDRLKFFLLFTDRTEVISIVHTIKICRDPKDDMYLELALSCNADCIVTRDKDLLVLHPFRNIPIITPEEFVTQF
jgi:uncharacterized protein